ncbi:MAG: hypothetical protein NTX25_12515 [Proteobacteria bacterium]|nr:hypothetical protein [Pseudomonadota bacterium]
MMQKLWLSLGLVPNLLFADIAAEGDSASDTVTYYQAVAPILQQQCQSCHQVGAIASFLPLSTYAEVKPLAKKIAKLTAARKMPPFNPDNSGSCTTYQNANVLEDQEIQTLAKWAEQGAPEGEFVSLPLPINSNELPGQTHQPKMEESYLPNAVKHDDYRCFVMSPGFSGTKSKFLTDYIVVPGDNKLVHHVVVYQVSSSKVAADARLKDDADEGPGYSCFGGAGVSGIRMLMNWSPGTGIVSLPQSTGIRMEPDLPLLVQIHYHIVGTPGSDQSQIKMKLADSVPFEMTPTFLAPNKPLNIPPQQKTYVHEGVNSLSTSLGNNKPLRILGVRSHMHKLGVQMHVGVTTETGDHCLIDVPHII